MKKFFFVVLGLLFAVPAFAASIEVAPKVVSHFYEDVDNAIGYGVSVDVKDTLPVPIVFMSSVEFVSTEENTLEGDAIVWSLGTGYDVKVSENLTFRPYGSLDFASISVDGPVDASNDTGKSLGVQARYSVSDRISLFAGLGHQWMETKVSFAGASQKVDLNNTILSAGLSVKF